MKARKLTENIEASLLLQELFCGFVRFSRVCKIKVEEHSPTVPWTQTLLLNALYACLRLLLVPRSKVDFCTFPQ